MTQSEAESIGTWWKPIDARHCHIFKDGRSIGTGCGWMYFGGGEPVDPEEDSYREGEDCKSCCRRAGLLEGANDE